MKDALTRSGARRRGDEYQDFVGLDLLLDWLEHTDRYQWIKFEADKAGYLDDVVALKSDNSLVLMQVKYSNHPDDSDDAWTWSELLQQKENTNSLLQKWSTSLVQFLQQGVAIKGSLITNRSAGKDLQQSLHSNTNMIDFDRIPSNIKKQIISQLGSRDAARTFFANFEFRFNYPNYNELYESLQGRFTRLGGNTNGWHNLEKRVREWVAFKNKPRAGGEIYLPDIRHAALWNIPRGLDQEFAIPHDYVLPSDNFHNTVLKKIYEDQENLIVIKANPGVGKSTYCSFLYQELRNKNLPVIRHHYFLSTFDTNHASRLDSERAAESLVHDLLLYYPESLGSYRDQMLDQNYLKNYIEECGRYYADRATRMVIIIDGLDHVYRERRSVDELRRFLEHLVEPVQDGITIVLATQPVSDEQQPQNLLRTLNQNDWILLDVLTSKSVDEWLIYHIDTVWPDLSQNLLDGRFRELSDAFFERSKGHPLYLKYALERLKQLKRVIFPSDVLGLPECPSIDIVNYYQNLWQTLDKYSKATLTLFAACPFSWTQENLIQCLMRQQVSLPDASQAIDNIRYLLQEDILGLRAFHSSLLVFIQGLKEYQRHASFQIKTVLDWFSSDEAPEYLVWGYTWLLQSKLGNYQALLRGITREWAVKAFASRQSRNLLRQIITLGIEKAIEQRDLIRILESATLYERCFEYNNMDFYREVYAILLYPQLIVDNRNSLHKQLLSDLWGLNNTELASLAEYCALENQNENLGRCFEEMHRRLKRPAYAHSRWNEIVFPFLKISALPDCVSSYRILEFATLNRENKLTYEMLLEYGRLLWIYKNSEELRAATNFILSPSNDMQLEQREINLIQRFMVLHAIEEDLDIDGLLPISDTVSPHLVIYNKLRGKELSGNMIVEFPDVEIYNNRRIVDYEEAEPTWTLYYDAIFVFIAKHILSQQDETTRWLANLKDKNWSLNFLSHLNLIAQHVVSLIDRSETYAIAWFYEQLELIPRPNVAPNDENYLYTKAANQAAMIVSFDLFVLLSHLSKIGRRDLEVLNTSSYCYFANWLNLFCKYRRNWLDTDALAWLFSNQIAYWQKYIEYFPNRAEQCAVLASIFIKHGDAENARFLIQMACENLVTYGEHKDLLLNEVLDSVVIFNQHKQDGDDVQGLLIRLIPSISAILDYTDGDETRHTIQELAHALGEISPQLLLPYYQWLTAREEYYNAENVFHVWLRKVSLDDPVNRAIARTGLDDGSLKVLQERSDKGDKNARTLIDEMTEYYGFDSLLNVQDEKYVGNVRRVKSKAKVPSVRKYPPDQLAKYVHILRKKNIYPLQDALSAWIKYWVSRDKKNEIYSTIEHYIKTEENLEDIADDMFDLAISLYGKNVAYPWLIQAQKEKNGWHHYWSNENMAKRRFNTIMHYYPESWENFLYETIKGRDSYRITSYLDHFCFVRILEYCLLMKQYSLAKVLVETMVNMVTQYTSPATLIMPAWVQADE